MPAKVKKEEPVYTEPSGSKYNENKVIVYLKPDDMKLLDDFGKKLNGEGYPGLIKRNGKVNRSGTIQTLLYLISGKKVEKV